MLVTPKPTIAWTQTTAAIYQCFWRQIKTIVMQKQIPSVGRENDLEVW